MRRTRAAVAAVTVGVAVWISGPSATAYETGPRLKVARYWQVDGPARFPSRIVIRCRGWAEDSAAVLKVVKFGGETAVYRCLNGSEV